MTTFKKFLAESLRDPKFKKAYDDLEVEFSLIKQVLDKRLEKGMSQKELAEKIGTKQASIARFEAGNHNPSLLFLKKLSKALGGKLEIKI